MLELNRTAGPIVSRSAMRCSLSPTEAAPSLLSLMADRRSAARRPSHASNGTRAPSIHNSPSARSRALTIGGTHSSPRSRSRSIPVSRRSRSWRRPPGMSLGACRRSREPGRSHRLRLEGRRFRLRALLLGEALQGSRPVGDEGRADLGGHPWAPLRISRNSGFPRRRRRLCPRSRVSGH